MEICQMRHNPGRNNRWFRIDGNVAAGTCNGYRHDMMVCDLRG